MTEQEMREKVIRGLEQCMIDVYGQPCNCPYDGNGGCISSLMADALTLLKAQEPATVEPKKG